MRRAMTLVGAICLAACRGGKLAERERTPPSERTASPISTGGDTASLHQRIEGTNTGIELEAPRRIPGMIATLTHLMSTPGKPDQTNLTALRGDLATLEDAMRDDFGRVGLADTGAFRALTDSIGNQLGGGPGGMAKPIDAKELPQLTARVQRLVGVYNQWMSHARR